MRIFTSADFNPMSWAEYGRAIQALLERIQSSGLRFDAIAPILRSGGIPGGALAISLQITRIVPLQFKYLRNPARLELMISLPSLLQELPAAPHILICENNTSSGDTARAAVDLLKQRFPSSTLCYATVARVFGGPDSLDRTEAYFYGVQTDERLIATEEEIARFGLRRGVTLFPWETARDELAEINQVSG